MGAKRRAMLLGNGDLTEAEVTVLKEVIRLVSDRRQLSEEHQKLRRERIAIQEEHLRWQEAWARGKRPRPTSDSYPTGSIAIVQCDQCLVVAVKGQDGAWRDNYDARVEPVRIFKILKLPQPAVETLAFVRRFGFNMAES